jgi:hypothetical protein
VLEADNRLFTTVGEHKVSYRAEFGVELVDCGACGLIGQLFDVEPMEFSGGEEIDRDTTLILDEMAKDGV